MSIVDFNPLSETELDALAVWVDAHYVKGLMIREDDGRVRPMKNIEMYASHQLNSKRRGAALELIERYGCCMKFCDRFNVTVEDPDNNDQATRERQVIYCGWTNEPCPRAQIQTIVDLFSILNSEHIDEYRSNDIPENIAHHSSSDAAGH